jgi:Holliday junction resolvase RusA-like endonuclease
MSKKKIIDWSAYEETFASNFQEGQEIVSFMIPGRPMTKKTHNEMAFIPKLNRSIMLPSKTFAKYEKGCEAIVKNAWHNLNKAPIDFGVGIEIKVWLDTWTMPDHVGILQSLGDIFEKHHLVSNDRWITWVNASQHWLQGVDRESARTEIKITRLKHPYEDYKSKKKKS